METKNVPIDKVLPDPANVREHDTANLVAIKASLLRFGQQKPIVVDKKGVIRAGNGTWEAAKSLEWSHIDIVESDLHGAEMMAYAIADNRTAELATWDQKALDKQLAGLDEELRNIAYFNADDHLPEAVDGELPDIQDEEKMLTQMTFTIHVDQKEAIEAAISSAKSLGPFVGTENENSNGNALARVCETWRAPKI
jgi:hypothetical protein